MSETPIIVTKSKTAPGLDEQFRLSPDFSVSQGTFLDYRKKAWQVFNSLTFPTGNEEAWKRTSLKSLPLNQVILPDPKSTGESGAPASLTNPVTDEAHGGQIIFENQKVTLHLDDDLAKKGVIFSDLLHVQKEQPEILEKVLKNAKTYQEDKFSALAAAFGQNGVLLYIPKNVNVEKPLHSLIWSSGRAELNAVKIFVYLEENSTATYVLESSSANYHSAENVHATLIEVQVGTGARLNFVELQSLDSRAWNFSHEKVEVGRDAEVDWIFGSLGSHLTKNFSDLNLTGQGSTGKMSGFFFTNGTQHLDHDTQQNHLAPNSTSDLLFKGALLGESRSVWQGMIYVAENAVKTDGYQANRNLVLSSKARADSIPGLEILTDDVRCSHGATVGKIDTDQVFYLESRGIPRKEAEKLIVEGFFDPIMQRIPFAGVRSRFQSAIEEKMQDY